jgi:hypothetical protein
LRIVLGDATLARYPEGGGHWCWFLQYALGLRALGHDVTVLELLRTSGQRELDLEVIRGFFARMGLCGLADSSVLLLFDEHLDLQPIERSEPFGRSALAVKSEIADADLLLNFCCGVRQPLLSQFKRRALLDFDPGHLQVSALEWEMGIGGHDVCLTAGARIGSPRCEVPLIGREWRFFEASLYLPMWQTAPDPGPDAAFSSITQWTWEDLPWRGGLVSVSKRAAYMSHAELPRMVPRPFELAANIGDEDPAADRAYLLSRGWRLVEPHQVAASVAQYQEYIRRSRAEFICPKPIHAAFQTGWFSERSMSYLAIGRPVLAQETGFSDRLPVGAGLLSFRDLAEAAAGVLEIDGNYARHSRAARELAEAQFDSRKRIPEMLAACG